MMRFPESSSQSGQRARTAFTLIELLVVVAIIVLLLGLLLGGLSAAKKSAKKVATQAVLSSLQTGLNSYFSDFNMYPTSSNAVAPAYADIKVGHGPAMLAEGLMGYLQTGDGAGSGVAASDPHYGFRIRTGGLGKIYGPYATDDPKSYRINSDIAGERDQCFIDSYGHEILYYRATGNMNSVGPATNIFDTAASNPLFVSDDCKYAADGSTILADIATATPEFFKDVFDRKTNLVSSGTTPVTGATSFLLLSAGADGTYFTGDDVVMSNH